MLYNLPFLKTMQKNESSIDSWFSIAHAITGNILVLELMPRMCLDNQIAGFFKA